MLRITLFISLLLLLDIHGVNGQSTDDDIWLPRRVAFLDLNNIAVARVGGSENAPVIDILMPQYKSTSNSSATYTYFAPVKKTVDGKETEEFLPQTGTKNVGNEVDFVLRLSAKIELLNALRIDGTEFSTEQLKVALKKPTHVIVCQGSVSSVKARMSKFHSAVFRNDLIVLIMSENQMAESFVNGRRVTDAQK